MDSGALYRLMAWLSPSYPVGAFSYSQGLETLVQDGVIADSAALTEWLSAVLLLGAGRCDAILFAETHRAAMRSDIDRVAALAQLALAFASAKERRLEAVSQGEAFANVTIATWQSVTLTRLKSRSGLVVPYPIAVGAAAADHGIALEPALAAYMHALSANLVSAAMRLVPLGHTDGQRALLALEPFVRQSVAMGLAGGIEDLGGVTVMADLAAMKHETLYTRIFRS